MSVFSDYQPLELIKQPQMNLLKSRGVKPHAFSHPECLRMVRGVSGDDGYLSPSNEGECHFAFLVKNRFGDDIDIAFWNPDTGDLTTELNRAFVLGEEQIGDPWFCANGGYLEVHPSPWEWLVNGKEGIVILREELAFDYLHNVPYLLVNNTKFGEWLREMIQPRSMPKILVSIEEKAA